MTETKDFTAPEETDVENQNAQNQSSESSEDRTGPIGTDENGTADSEQDSKFYDKLSEELQDAKDKHLRLLAEFENFRRRTSKENFELISSANAKLLGKLTEVLDNFNLAFDPKHKSEKLEDLEKGTRLIYNKFKEILSDEGLAEIDPVGKEFDPNLHDALMQQPSDTVPENHISQVLQKGYKAKDKILKHAKVIVSTGKP
ncbi:MAG: nucleotide exchange factor GrpE [Fibrobacterota bacterium]|nr:nucleotide exchange factor GrpE [Fibrobacterota bacterium]